MFVFVRYAHGNKMLWVLGATVDLSIRCNDGHIVMMICRYALAKSTEHRYLP